MLAWDLAGSRRLTPRHAIAEPVSGPEVDALVHLVDNAPGGDAVAYVVVTQTDDLEPRTTAQWLDLTTGKSGEVTDTGPFLVAGVHAWAPDGRRFATGGADGFVRLWDWQTGQLDSERQVTQSPITGLDYTGDGTQLVVGEERGKMRTIDAETLTPVHPPLSLGHHINRLFASPDNRTAIALTLDAPVLSGEAGFAIVDLIDGRVLHEGPGAGVPSYADFSPDGQRVAVSYADRVGVLDVETGEWTRPPADSHEGAVTSLAYAADGAVVASGGSDGRVGLWDGKTGALLGTVRPGQPNTPVAVEFLPDGHTVQIASLDGAVYTWDTRPQHWLEYACTVVRRNLTNDEWRDTFGDRRYHQTCPQYPAGE